MNTFVGGLKYKPNRQKVYLIFYFIFQSKNSKNFIQMFIIKFVSFQTTTDSDNRRQRISTFGRVLKT